MDEVARDGAWETYPLRELTDDEREAHQKAIRKIKRRVNPELKTRHWDKRGYHALGREALLPTETYGSLEYIEYDEVDEDTFRERFEIPAIPCMIRGATGEWPAQTKWSVEWFMQEYGSKPFDCGSFNYTDITVETFIRYLQENTDDSPIYIFDPYFSSKYPDLRPDYCLPKYFRDDYFQYAGEKDRPLYRWFLIGPERSGTGIHIDPNETSAWNTLLAGRKRWCMFPPHILGRKIKPAKGASDEGIDWFMKIYPRVKDDPELEMIEVIQEAGDTIFVPGGWWHVVLNIGLTISVTQNYASRINMPRVWSYMTKRKPKFCRRWYHKMPVEISSQLVCTGFDVDGEMIGSDTSSASSSSYGPSSSSSSSSDGGASDSSGRVPTARVPRKMGGGMGSRPPPRPASVGSDDGSFELEFTPKDSDTAPMDAVATGLPGSSQNR